MVAAALPVVAVLCRNGETIMTGRSDGKRVPANFSPHRQRNLPAYLAKTKNLEGMLADETLPDPLYGNYQVVPQQEIVTAFQARGQLFRLSALATQVDADTLGAFSTTVIGQTEAGEAMQNRHLALTTADFNSDGREEIAAVYENAGELYLLISSFDATSDPGKFTPSKTTRLNIQTVGQVALTSGFLYESPKPALVLAWLDAGLRINLRIYQISPDLSPIARGSIADESLADANADYAVERGDVNGDGLDEVVLAWRGQDEMMYVKVYAVDADFNFIPKPRSAGEPTAGKRHLALAVSDYNYDAKDEIAVAWEKTAGRATLRLFEATRDLAIVAKGVYTDESVETALYSGSQIAVTAAEFLSSALLNEREGVVPSHIVLGYEVRNNAVVLRLFETDKELNLDASKHLKATTTIGGDLPYGLAEFDLKLSFGNLAGGAFNSVVVTAIGVSRNQIAPTFYGFGIFTVGIVQATEDLSAFNTFQARYSYDQAQDPKLQFYLGLALGDLTGDSIRVGNARRLPVSDVMQILAVINAPPLHVARYEEDGKTVEVNLNFDGNSYLNFNATNTKGTYLSLSTKKDWGYSKELRYGLGGVAMLNTSLVTKYGYNFSRVSVSSYNTSFTLNQPQLWRSDAIIALTQDYTVWEYSVYDRTGTQPVGYLALVFPSLLGPVITTLDGESLDFGYYPDHTLSNILSYPKEPPADYKEEYEAYTGWTAKLSDEPQSTTVTLTKMREENAQTQSQSETVVSDEGGFNPSFKGINVGISAKVEGTYAENEISTVNTSFQEITDIQFYFSPLSHPYEYAYAARPLIYWAQPWGYLKIDYVVEPVINDLFPTAWQRIYEARCDPAFSLPWFNDPYVDEEYRLLTRDIYFEGQEDGLVEIQVTIHNYSLKATPEIPVQLYDGDPRQGAQPIGGIQYVPPQQGRKSYTITVGWSAPESGTRDIYAWIDPEGQIPDLNRENNLGWARYAPARRSA